MSRRVRVLSTLLVAAGVVWILAPRGLGSATLGRTSRVEGWALFANQRITSVALVAAAVEKDEVETVFLYARFWGTPRVLLGSERFLAVDAADTSGAVVMVPRRTIAAIDLIDGSPTQCAVALHVSRLDEPADVSGVICGVPFSRSEAVGAAVEKRTHVRDSVAFP